MKIKRIRNVARAVVMTLAVVISPLAGVGLAHAASTDVWTGAGDGTTFSDASNWQGDAVPAAGDILSFPTFASNGNPQEENLTNDLNYAWGGLTIGTSGLTGSDYNDVIFSNSLEFTAGAILRVYNPDEFSLYFANNSDGITADGDFTVVGAHIYEPLTIHGSLTLNSADFDLQALTSGSSLTGVILQGDSPELNSDYPTGQSYSYPTNITVAVSASDAELELGAYSTGSCGMSGSDPCVSHPTTYGFSGNVSLNANLDVLVGDDVTANFTGALVKNSYNVVRDQNSGATGVLNVGGTSVQQQPQSVTDSDSQPSASVNVVDKETLTLDGSRGSVNVSEGGILKGIGTMSDLYVNPGGTVAPGHSPGKLTVTDSVDIDGNYQAELKDATAGDYDQIQVAAGTTANPAVTLGSGATLNLVLYPGANIKTGDKFTIIDNGSSNAVSGTFQNLPEGAHVSTGNLTFSISYVGGDGNDVVLTALDSGTAPKAGNTGVMALVTANPAVTAGAGLLAIAVLVLLSRKQLNRR